MAVYFLDTSALIKRQVREVGSAWVRSLTTAKSAHTIFIARITAVEVFAAISRRQRGGSLSVVQAGAILGHFRRHLDQRYVIIEVTPALLADAMSTARQHGLRAYDAVQLAAAREASRVYRTAGVGVITLVSADSELNAAAAVEGLAVDDPNAHR